MNKDTLINISLIENISTIYDIVNNITSDVTDKSIRGSSVHYLLNEKFVFHLAIQRLRLSNQTNVSIGNIYNSMGCVYDVLPYFIINYEDDYTYESGNQRYQFEIKNFPFFVIKFYEELHRDDEVRHELCKQLYKYSKDLIEDDVDYKSDSFINYYLDKINPDNCKEGK